MQLSRASIHDPRVHDQGGLCDKKKLHTICPLFERDVAFEINKDSPFYKVCPNNDENCPEFELLVLFQGSEPHQLEQQ